MPSVVLSCVVFFVICACEYTAGVWSSTFFAEYKGFTADKAAKSAMLFYIGMTLGRFVSGIVGKKLKSLHILKICVGILLSASVIIALPLPCILPRTSSFRLRYGPHISESFLSRAHSFRQRYFAERNRYTACFNLSGHNGNAFSFRSDCRKCFSRTVSVLPFCTYDSFHFLCCTS